MQSLFKATSPTCRSGRGFPSPSRTLHFRIRDGLAGSQHADDGFFSHRRPGNLFDLQAVPVDVFKNNRAIDTALGDGKDIFGHGIASGQGFVPQPESFETLIKGLVRVPPHRLGAVGDGPPGRQVHPFQITVADLLGAEIVGKVGQPGEGAFIFGNRLQQPVGRPDPVERRHDDERIAQEDGHEPASDQAHVMVQRQPGNKNIVFPQMQGFAIAL